MSDEAIELDAAVTASGPMWGAMGGLGVALLMNEGENMAPFLLAGAAAGAAAEYGIRR